MLGAVWSNWCTFGHVFYIALWGYVSHTRQIQRLGPSMFGLPKVVSGYVYRTLISEWCKDKGSQERCSQGRALIIAEENMWSNRQKIICMGWASMLQVWNFSNRMGMWMSRNHSCWPTGKMGQGFLILTPEWVRLKIHNLSSVVPGVIKRGTSAVETKQDQCATNRVMYYWFLARINNLLEKSIELKKKPYWIIV